MGNRVHEISAIINARVESTRVQHKLIRNFCDTTLLDIAIKKLCKINVKRKYVATCEKDIIDIYKKYSDEVELLERKTESIKKGMCAYNVMWEHYKRIDTKYILIINPCCPFTTNDTYQRALSFFNEQNSTKTLTSFKKIQDVILDENKKPINVPDLSKISTFCLSPIYKLTHVFHIFDIHYFFDNGKFWDYTTNNPAFLETTKLESMDIDTEEDFYICENIYKGLKYGN